MRRARGVGVRRMVVLLLVFEDGGGDIRDVVLKMMVCGWESVRTSGGGARGGRYRPHPQFETARRQ